jgi:hypothetical protein
MPHGLMPSGRQIIAPCWPWLNIKALGARAHSSPLQKKSQETIQITWENTQAHG